MGKWFAVAFGFCVIGLATAKAEMQFSFVESAPKDSFRIINNAACATGAVEVIIDLSTSAGNLVFDTTDTGAGVEVYQPFELVTGAEHVLSATPISDGDSMVHINLSSLSPGDEVVFTIDVDDQLASGELGQTRIAGSEIAGASATVISNAQGAVTGNYDQKSVAVVAFESCL